MLTFYCDKVDIMGVKLRKFTEFSLIRQEDAVIIIQKQTWSR